MLRVFKPLFEIEKAIKKGKGFGSADNSAELYTREFNYWQNELCRYEEQLTFAEADKVVAALKTFYNYCCEDNKKFKDEVVTYYF